MEPRELSEGEVQRLREETERVIDHAKQTIEHADRVLWQTDKILMAMIVVETALFAVRLASEGHPFEALAGPFDRSSSIVLGLSLLAEALTILAFALTPWFVARRARWEIADPVATSYWPPGTGEKVKDLMREYYSKEDPAPRALETFRNAYRAIGTNRIYLGLLTSGLAFYYFERVRGPWAILNFLMVQAILLWSFPTKAGMERWTRRRVAACLDTALPPDFMG